MKNNKKEMHIIATLKFISSRKHIANAIEDAQVK